MVQGLGRRQRKGRRRKDAQETLGLKVHVGVEGFHVEVAAQVACVRGGQSQEVVLGDVHGDEGGGGGGGGGEEEETVEEEVEVDVEVVDVDVDVEVAELELGWELARPWKAALELCVLGCVLVLSGGGR